MKEFFKNIKFEWDKITWPTGKEMKTGITQVFVFMVLLSLFFAGVDALISTGLAVANREPAPIVNEVPVEDEETTVAPTEASDEEVETTTAE